MSYFSNATTTITRSEGTRGPSGYTENGTNKVLQCRGDFQESGRSLERLQQLHETGDGLFFAEQSVTAVEPGDSVEFEMDDGRTVDGSVEEVISIDSSILVTLS